MTLLAVAVSVDPTFKFPDIVALPIVGAARYRIINTPLPPLPPGWLAKLFALELLLGPRKPPPPPPPPVLVVPEIAAVKLFPPAPPPPFPPDPVKPLSEDAPPPPPAMK